MILNLGCGTKTSSAPGVVNIDWSYYQRLAGLKLVRRFAPLVVGPSRAQKLRDMPAKLVSHDLSKGIPAADHSVDVVYHSHLLEHLDRDVAERFMTEVRRVLKQDGIHRIVVPDLEPLLRAAVADLESEEGDHDVFIAAILEQSVRRESRGTMIQHQPRRFLENLILGDARRRGETHQWMYDFKNLAALLRRTGFVDVERMSFDRSNIEDWDRVGLDRDSAGAEYKLGSLYVEARPGHHRPRSEGSGPR